MNRNHDHQTWQREMRALWKVGGPLVVNFLAVAGMSFADAVMAGRIGAEALAAVAVGGSTWMLGFTACLGLLMALSPIISRHYGAGRYELIGRYTRQGFWLAQVLAFAFLIVVQLFIGPAFERIGVDPEFRDLSVGYVRAIYLGMPAMTVFLVLRFTTEGIGVTRPIMYTSLFSLVCNVFLNYVLMFGKFGFPALGAVGCGLASAITMWLMTIGLAIYVYRHPRYRPLEIFSRVAPLRWAVFAEVLSLGWPIMIAIVAESGLFSAISILIGTLGTNIAAAHQIALNFASTMFMVPLALSAAITVRVGHELGAGRPAAARFAGGFGILFCGLFMTVSALLMLVFRDAVVHLYTTDIDVQTIAISLLLMAALFQVADGVQIGAAGALRGYKDTRVPMLINTFSYWVLAFPCAYVAARMYATQPSFIWAAFVLGLTVSAVLLTSRFRILTARIEREPHKAPV
jgi:MATE family multidrug resistance protein